MITRYAHWSRWPNLQTTTSPARLSTLATVRCPCGVTVAVGITQQFTLHPAGLMGQPAVDAVDPHHVAHSVLDFVEEQLGVVHWRVDFELTCHVAAPGQPLVYDLEPLPDPEWADALDELLG